MMPLAKVEWVDVKGYQVINESENYSSTSIKMMGDTNFLGTLMNFPKAGRCRLTLSNPW